MWLSRRRTASGRPTSAALPLHDIRTLEECAFNAWPAHQVATCNGWVLRLSEGYTKRANSANALCPTGDFSQTMALAEAFYARHDQPAIFRLSPLAGAGADAHLARAGYQRSGETLVLCARLDESIDAGASDDQAAGAVITPHADLQWRRGYAAAAGVPDAARGLHERLLDAIAMPCGFASLGTAPAPIAFGMGVLERGLVGLFDIVVDPGYRRQGAARRLMRDLMHWGRTQGASQAYLQVVADNAPALALYQGLGFREAYRYHYRIPGA